MDEMERRTQQGRRC